MKKIGLIIFVAALVIGVGLANVISFGKSTARIFSFSINSGISGSGNTASEKRGVSDFRAIEVGGIFEVQASSGTEFGVEVEADDNLLPLIETDVRGGVLQITAKNKISSKNPIRVRITAPNIESLEVSGASKVSLDNINNENLQIDASGASKTTIFDATKDLTADVSGAAKIDAENLQSENVVVDASGAGKASVHAAADLKADASGASSILYAGNPKNLIKNVSGAGSIQQK